MCGLAGILALASPALANTFHAIPEHWLHALDAHLIHRGPDGQGRFRDAIPLTSTTQSTHQPGVLHVALIHRRLAILDPLGGRQPMLALRRAANQHPPSSPSSASSPSPPTPAPFLFLGPAGPPSPAPAQPAYAPIPPDDHLAALIFNGCIYNHAALRAQLLARGCHFTSHHADTEVLLQGALALGPTLPNHLDGMYAYALWQRRPAPASPSPRLTLARDPAGEKPLYLTAFSATDPRDPARTPLTVLAFASTVPALVALRRAANAPIAPDPLLASLWLRFGWWSQPPIDGLAEVPPGATLVFDAPRLAALANPANNLAPSLADALIAHPAHVVNIASRSALPLDADSLPAALQAAITSRLDADVPLGCFLSGGVDSSLVAALAHAALQRAGKPPLRTFSVRMPDSALDESAHALAVARHLGTNHLTLDAAPADSLHPHAAADDLLRLLTQLGLPLGDSSLLPTHWLAAAARQHVTVALGGDGGDELFAGYRRHRAFSLLHRFRTAMPLARAALTLPAAGRSRIAAALRATADSSPAAPYDELLALFPLHLFSSLLEPAFARRALDAAALPARRAHLRSLVDDARHDDFRRYLPFDLMRKLDTASMAVALEVRAPFLATDLVARALATPLAVVRSRRQPKGLLRDLARRLVPASVVERPKQGFAIPIDRWFRDDFRGLGSLLRDTLADTHTLDSLNIPFRPGAVHQLLDDHLRHRHNHGQRLFALLSLALFARSLRE